MSKGKNTTVYLSAQMIERLDEMARETPPSDTGRRASRSQVLREMLTRALGTQE